MTRLLISMTWLLVNFSAQTQNFYGNNWVIGSDTSEGGTRMQFTNDGIKLSSISFLNDHSGASAIISDKHGNLSFFSNGCVVMDSLGGFISDGLGLSRGVVEDEYCELNGNPIPTCVIALPTFNEDQYVLLVNHMNNIVPSNGTLETDTVYLNLIDMSLNNGLGKVVKKYIPILIDTLSSTYIAAVRHGNGKDWWIASPEFDSDCYYLTHIADTAVVEVKRQCMGAHFGQMDWTGQAYFSPDGKKYARVHWEYGLVIFDFDRCTGAFSKPIVIPKWSDKQRAGLAFSPSGRFLYVNTHTEMWQFDLEAGDIEASRLLVGEYDGFNTPFSTRFYLMANGPDNKIYIAPPGQHQHIHVIHQPDSLGLACQFEQHAIELLAYNSWAFPTVTNYSLGAEPDDCAVQTESPPEGMSNDFTISPNPVTKNCLITLKASFSNKKYHLKIFNVLGECVRAVEFNGPSFDLDVSGLTSGVWFVQVLDEKRFGATQKLVVKR